MTILARTLVAAAAALLSFSMTACKNDGKMADKPKYTEGSCCAKAAAAGKTCEHPCCAEATKAGTVCKKCNPT